MDKVALVSVIIWYNLAQKAEITTKLCLYIADKFKLVRRGQLLSVVKGKVGASRVSRLTHLWKEEKSLISLLTARKAAQYKFLHISVQFWVKKLGKNLSNLTVVTGWYYCYYPVSGTRPHYEWVGFFFAHHVGLKSFQKEHFFSGFNLE